MFFFKEFFYRKTGDEIDRSSIAQAATNRESPVLPKYPTHEAEGWQPENACGCGPAGV
jgi:hypothetical protein